MSHFQRLHPLLLFLYLSGVILLGMLLMHPIFQSISMLCAFGCVCILEGKKGFRWLLAGLGVATLTAILNTAFYEAGSTTLLTILGRRFTLESFTYGFFRGLMCATVLLWFVCWTQLLTSDKFIWLFGRTLPSISLILTMVLRFVPMYRRSFMGMYHGRAALGKAGDGSLAAKVREVGLLLSALTSAALESAVTTADSMRSRGYELSGKSTFSIYPFCKKDWGGLGIILLCLSVCGYFFGTGSARLQFFPKIEMNLTSESFWAALLVYTLTLLLPILYGGAKELQWNFLKSSI